MSRYRDPPSRTDRAIAIAAVLAVHAGLGALILTGQINAPAFVEQERTTLLDLHEPPPPPPPPPPPRQEESAAEKEQGAAGLRAEPTPIVAPPPRVVVPAPTPVVAAPIAGTGNAPRSGAAAAGTGPGAGGAGTGPGGGGSGGRGASGGIGVEARLVSGGLTRSDYRRLPIDRASGRARLALSIGPDGRVESCRANDSSGSPALDSALCALLQARSRWLPARDKAGNPISVGLYYVATWERY